MEHLDEKIKKRFEMSLPEESPSLSLIIPTLNCFERVKSTLESIKQQEYPNLEVIIIDAGSTDHTLKVINQYSSMVSRIYAVSEYNLPEMLNRGVALATNRYLAFLLPGSFYVSKYSFNIFATRAVRSNFPDVIYTGVIQRELRKDPLYVNRPIHQSHLKLGNSPSHITACWFRADLFETIGKINVDYKLRYYLDLFCRIEALKEKRIERLDSYLVDFDFGVFTYKKALTHAAETWSVLQRHYGKKRALLWFFTLDHLELLRFVMRYLKHQIFRR